MPMDEGKDDDVTGESDHPIWGAPKPRGKLPTIVPVLPAMLAVYIILPAMLTVYIILPAMLAVYIILPAMLTVYIILPAMLAVYIILPAMLAVYIILPAMLTVYIILPAMLAVYNTACHANCIIYCLYTAANVELALGIYFWLFSTWPQNAYCDIILKVHARRERSRELAESAYVYITPPLLWLTTSV